VERECLPSDDDEGDSTKATMTNAGGPSALDRVRLQ